MPLTAPLHQPVVEALKPYRTVFFQPLSGNNGDDLIRLGAFSLLRDAGVSLVTDPRAADAIVVRGGGCVTSVSRGVFERLKHLLDNSHSALIMLPSSVFIDSDDFAQFARSVAAKRRNVTWFCREPVSYQRVTEIAGGSFTVSLSHDMALYLTEDDITSRLRRSAMEPRGLLVVERRDNEVSTGVARHQGFRIPLKHYVPPALKRRIKQTLFHRRMRHTPFARYCTAMAASHEPKLASSRATFLDVSDTTLCSFPQFLRTVHGAELVFTTRLHVAILCHILRRACYLMPTGGKYRKNETVFDYSLAGRSSVKLLDWSPAALRSAAPSLCEGVV